MLSVLLHHVMVTSYVCSSIHSIALLLCIRSHHLEGALQSVCKILKLFCLRGTNNHHEDDNYSINMRKQVGTLSAHVRVRRTGSVGYPPQNKRRQCNSQRHSIPIINNQARERVNVSKPPDLNSPTINTVTQTKYTYTSNPAKGFRPSLRDW